MPQPNFEKQTAIVLVTYKSGLDTLNQRSLIGGILEHENEIQVVIGPNFRKFGSGFPTGLGYAFHILAVPKIAGKLVMVEDKFRKGGAFDPFGERVEVDKYGYPKFKRITQRVDEETVKDIIPIVEEWHGQVKGARSKDDPDGARVALRGDDAFVVRNNEEWVQVWEGISGSVPEVDFEKYMVICATCTGTDKYSSVLIGEVARLEERIWVDIEIVTAHPPEGEEVERMKQALHYVTYNFCAIERSEADILFSTRYIFMRW